MDLDFPLMCWFGVKFLIFYDVYFIYIDCKLNAVFIFVMEGLTDKII